MINKLVITFMTAALIFVGAVNAATEDPQQALEAFVTGHGDSDFGEFTLSLTQPFANLTSDAAIRFTLDGSDAWRLIDGRLILSFPSDFNIDSIQLVEFSAEYGNLLYEAASIRVNGQFLSIPVDAHWRGGGSPTGGPGSVKAADGTPLSHGTVTFELTLSGIRNPSTAGEYRVSGAVLNSWGKTVAGPTPSSPFAIIGGLTDTVIIFPDTALTLRAGGVQNFTARAFDESGNEISGLEFIYSLSDDYDDIGTMTGSVLLATTVGTGRVVARSSDPSLFFEAVSGPITVLPGTLAEIEVDLLPDQVVGAPLRGQGSDIALRDDYDNLKFDLDLATTPIELVSLPGRLEPEVINDPSVLVNGTIDLTELGVEYRGASAFTQVVARANGIISNQAIVWFHGYDILGVTNYSGRSLDTIATGASVLTKVAVVNNGRNAPFQLVDLTARYELTGGETAVAFEGNANGIEDSIRIILPPHTGAVASDTVLFTLTSSFTFDGETYEVVDSTRVPVTVVSELSVLPVFDSFTPDTSVLGFPFMFDVAYQAISFAGPIDQAYLRIEFENVDDPQVGAVVYDNQPPVSDYKGDTIFHTDVPIDYLEVAQLPAGRYRVLGTYEVAKDGQIIASPTTEIDDIVLLPQPVVSYVDSSYSPTTVYSDRATSFVFDVMLESEYPLQFSTANGLFTLTGSSFNATVGLFGEGSRLEVGRNMLTSDLIFVPNTQAGGRLIPQASIRVQLPGIGTSVTVPINLSSVSLEVVELPAIQISSFEPVSPNAPRVNTGQHFSLEAWVANRSTSLAIPVDVILRSDGNSTFDTSLVIELIPPRDSILARFDVVASQTPDPAEVFQVSLNSEQATPLPPIDNIALVTIETPAQMELEYDIIGDAAGVVGRGEEFTLSVFLRNVGGADAGAGMYEISTGGVDFGLKETTGPISPDQTLAIPMIAPDEDVKATITFKITDTPIDANTDEPAILLDTSFSIPIEVQTVDADVFVEVESLTSPLVVPGRTIRLFDIVVTNRGESAVASARFNQITFTVPVSGAPALAADFFVADSTNLLEDENIVARSLISSDRIILTFDNFVLAPGATRRLTLATEVSAAASGQFSLRLERDDFDVRFLEGPLAGRPVEISSPTGNNILIDQSFRVRGTTLDDAFVIENNPFNPNHGPARFAYELPLESGIEFRVFTLTGELVYSRDIVAGAPGTEPNREQFIEWRGANGPGDVVLNGVYIVSLKITATGESVQRKVAVVK